MTVLVLRVAAAMLGLLLVYAGAFLYEDAEQNIQHRLMKIWDSIDDRQRGAMSLQVAFIQEIASATDRVLDRMLGPKLIALQAVGV